MKFDTDKLGDYVTDDAMERDIGVWAHFGDGIEIRFLRAGGSNTLYQRVAQRMMAPYRKRRTVDPADQVEILARIYARAVILDWRGVTSEGQDVEFNEENATAFFLAFPDLFDDLVALASERATFQEDFIREVTEDLGKNSGGRSAPVRTQPT